MNNAIIYARVSSKDQEVEGYSIPSQLKLLNEYASKNNYRIVAELTDIETAKKMGRRQFNHMISLIKNDKTIKHILVEKTDRLTRNMPDHAVIDQLISQSGITIHLVKENATLSNDSRSNEKFIFGIKALMAKNYSDNLSEEVKKGMQEKAAQGLYPSSAPYGYLNVRENGKSIIKVDLQAAPTVKKMFELYATGSYSLLKLRKHMLADGMVYRNGKKFYTSTVETILKNEFYTGAFFWKGRKYENASHEPIISTELFKQVQGVLINPRKGKSKKALFSYTNLITCGVCGCALTAELKKAKYIYYHCTGYKGNCKQAYIRQEVIESTFTELLENIHVPTDIQQIILNGMRESFKDKIEYHNNLVVQLEKQIKVLQNRIDQAYLDKLDQKISEEFWQSNTQKWMDEKEQLFIKLLATQKADSHYLENANLVLELAKNAAQMFKSRNGEQKRRMINVLVSNCSYKDETLDIQLKPVFEKILEVKKTGNWCALSVYFGNFSFQDVNLFGIKQLLFA